MRKFRWIFLLLLVVFSSFNTLKHNPFIHKEVKKAVTPFLIPEDHPIKPFLDRIFSMTRVTISDDTIVAAGFNILVTKPRSHIRLLQHPELDPYLLKVTVDSNTEIKNGYPDWYWFVNRCRGADRIAQIIKINKLKHFVVPKKWLYVLPAHPDTPQGPNYERKLVVLVVENMQLIEKSANKAKWKTAITKEILKELYEVMKYGGGSAWRPDNVWFTTSGKLALIDTEYPGKEADRKTITKYLSPEMQKYWTHLVKKRGG